eukprot:CAMPEP_0195146326 /NCGR_PEP_ID=MMETSP0448-20130528/171458_1 /TAXON_ID=66468 /ORGANISM="Heterocapsa triquestra, Strain CCMP 448" /LENGTH=51 /DNA_ID=CAMNT_0040184873 /DNA_START=80 /DNA_END=232 /DNA_ORIENTATION=-
MIVPREERPQQGQLRDNIVPPVVAFVALVRQDLGSHRLAGQPDGHDRAIGA